MANRTQCYEDHTDNQQIYTGDCTYDMATAHVESTKDKIEPTSTEEVAQKRSVSDHILSICWSREDLNEHHQQTKDDKKHEYAKIKRSSIQWCEGKLNDRGD